MFSRFRKKLDILKKDNKGAAIVVAIVAIAFIGMLVGMLVYMAYYNYLMKHIDKRNKDNFYSAEYALDIINAGLQRDISESMSEAYVEAMKKSANMDSEAMTLYFKNNYVKYLRARIEDTTDKWSVTHLTQMWEDADLIHATSAGKKGAYLEAIGGNNSLSLTNTDYFTLSNIRIVYTNDDGYISMIETDIRLKVPDLDFAQSAAKLNLEEFSLVANNSLINDSGNQDQMPSGFSASASKGKTGLAVSGSVYGGKKGIQIGNEANIDFIRDPFDESKNFDLTYRLIAKSIDVEDCSSSSAGVNIGEKYDTYVEDINITSANFNGNGKINVGDDLDIAGRNSKVVLMGHYKGYGNENTTSDGSSSILINGANTTLDFSKLDELVLSGHAYVGAKKYDADRDRLAMGSLYNPKTLSGNALIEAVNKKVLNSDKIDDEQTYDGQYEDMLGSSEYDLMTSAKELSGNTIIPQNTYDVMMGESMSVKANQLLYLVPTECIGYVKDSDEQIITKNPMTYSEYQTLITTPDKNSEEYQRLRAAYKASHSDMTDEEIDKEFDVTKAPGATSKSLLYEPVRLSVLWSEMGTTPYTNKCKAVYRRINGTVMVYLFLDFSADEDMANEFYRAYCKYAPDAVNLYVNSYIKDLKWNNNLTSQLTLAGNMFYLNNNDEVVVIEDSNQNSTKYLNMGTWAEEFSEKHEALMHTLKDNYDAMTSAQATTDVFDNLVVSSELSGMDSKSFISGDPSQISAYVGTKNVLYPSTTCPQNTALIITSGDVYVNGNFDGLILAGGNIYICSMCSKITYNPTKVIKAMQLEYVDPVLGDVTHVYDVFGASGQISYGVVTAGSGDDTIRLTDLITYQNWKKE